MTRQRKRARRGIAAASVAAVVATGCALSEFNVLDESPHVADDAGAGGTGGAPGTGGTGGTATGGGGGTVTGGTGGIGASGGAPSGGSATGGSGGAAGPCAGVCQGVDPMTTGALSFDGIGRGYITPPAGPACYALTVSELGYAITGWTCSGFGSRTLSVNGQAHPECVGAMSTQMSPSTPPQVAGGYCFLFSDGPSGAAVMML